MGGKLIASYDAFEKENTVYSLEPLAVLRVYLVSPSGEPSTGFYIEGTGGADIIFSNETLFFKEGINKRIIRYEK